MRSAIAIVSAVLAYMVVGAAGLFMLLAAWPGYVEAAIVKSYSLAMLLARLGVALMSALAAGVAAGRLSGLRAAWVSGAILAAVGAWIHVMQVWADYPVWYHAAYVLPIAPVMAAAAWPFDRARLAPR